jgi:hypothetical protein
MVRMGKQGLKTITHTPRAGFSGDSDCFYVGVVLRIVGRQHGRCADDNVHCSHRRAPLLRGLSPQHQSRAVTQTPEDFLKKDKLQVRYYDANRTQAAISKAIFISWETRTPGDIPRFPGARQTTISTSASCQEKPLGTCDLSHFGAARLPIGWSELLQRNREVLRTPFGIPVVPVVLNYNRVEQPWEKRTHRWYISRTHCHLKRTDPLASSKHCPQSSHMAGHRAR